MEEKREKVVKRLSGKVSERGLYRAYLLAINGLLHLTKVELSVMAELLEAKNRIDKSFSGYPLQARERLLLGTDTRRLIYTSLGLSQHSFNNFVKRLRNKGCLVSSGSPGNLSISPKVVLDITRETGKIEVIFEFLIQKEEDGSGKPYRKATSGGIGIQGEKLEV